MIGDRVRHALDWRLAAIRTRLDSANGQIRRLDERLADVTRELHELAESTARSAEDARVVRALMEQEAQPVLRAIVDREGENRRRLNAVRGDDAYAAAYTERSPLVSITVATRDRPELLVGRALPSLLAQTHADLEVLVVGDAAAPEVGEAVAALDDSRVHYSNLTQRVTAHADPERHWLVGSTMARNEAVRLARGSWLLHFDDDDSLRPNAISDLLELARDRRAEVAYGGFETFTENGGVTTALAFPPTPGLFGWQGALVHGGLRFFERELVAAHLPMPGDAYLLERMLRAGVRFAMLEQVVWDYFPSRLRARSSVSSTSAQISRTPLSSSSE